MMIKFSYLLATAFALLSGCSSTNGPPKKSREEAGTIVYCKSVSDVITRADKICGPYYDKVKTEVAKDEKREAQRVKQEEEKRKRAIEQAAFAPRNPPNAKRFNLAGEVTLLSSNGFGGSSNNCYGLNGYDDIAAGMQVTVRNGDGKVLAVGSAGAGERIGSVECRFKFEIAGIPRSDFYAIGIGTSDHRGLLNFSFDEMQRKNWSVAFFIG